MKSTLSRRVRWGVVGLFAMVFGSVVLTGLEARSEETTPIQVSVGEATTLTIEKFATLALADPAIADVLKLSDKEISIIGKKAGVTTLTIVYAEGKPTESRRVIVGNDAVTTTIRQMTGQQTITVLAIGDTLVLDGQVDDELQAQRAVQIATAYKDKVLSLLEVKKPRQIKIQNRVVEINTSAIRNIGFKWLGEPGEIRYAMDYAGRPGGAGIIVHGITPPVSEGGSALTSPLSVDSSVDVVLQLLITKNYARILSEPTLVTLSGKEASFLVGQEIPIVQQLPQSFTVEFKEVGVRMRIKPTADSQNQINTTIHAEVSQVIAVSSAFGIPIIGAKIADTTMQVKDGQTVVIAGLLENNFNRDFLRKVPWLADIPVFGYLFRKKEFEQAQREVIFFMKPEVVKDADAEAASAAKTPMMKDWLNKESQKDMLNLPPKEWTEDYEDRLHHHMADPATEKPATPAAPKEPTTNYTPARPAGQ